MEETTSRSAFHGVEAALVRSGKAAWEIAVRTGTPFWVLQDGKIVDLNPATIKAKTGEEVTSELHIRPATAADADAIWEIFHEVIQGGDTFAYEPETPREAGLRSWMEAPRAVYVAEHGGAVVGSYFLKDNQPGLGSHVCNAGYMVAGSARGLGVGRAMCAHSFEAARGFGYTAMQYNIVVATNTGAVALWQSMGFAIVGTLPQAFRHRRLGPVDAYVMHRFL